MKAIETVGENGQFIPDNERWLHEPVAKAKLDEAIAWAEITPVRDNLSEIEAAVNKRDCIF